jgi:ATP-dependent Clp protease ATP-binding subunit ClpB
MSGIVSIQLDHLRAMLADRRVTLSLDVAAEVWLAEKGYDPVYGARPLKRVIQRELQNPLAEMILAGKIADGDEVRVSAGEGGLVISGEAVSTEAA